MNKTANLNPNTTAFVGLSYINAILRLVESTSPKSLDDYLISPKFIYRGITKRHINNVSVNEIEDNNNANQIYKDSQADILNQASNKKDNPDDYLNEIYNSNLFKSLAPNEIRSGASIRLHNDFGDNNKNKVHKEITSAYYIQYIKNLISEVKNAYPSFNNLSDLEILAELQHKGAASCLVDFSQNILISLWFATQTDIEDFGYLFLYDINSDVFIRDNISFISRDNCNENIESLLLQTKKAGSYVYECKSKFWSWRPTNINSRIARQDSIFIFGMEPFLTKEHGVKVFPIIPEWKIPIQSALKTFFGLTAETIYPDSDGFASSNSKANSISPSTSYINPYFNKTFKDFDMLQSGISCMLKGEYGIALNLFHHFEGINNITQNIDAEHKPETSAAIVKLIHIELYHSIARCYLKLSKSNSSKLWQAEVYYSKAFDLIIDYNNSKTGIADKQDTNLAEYSSSTVCGVNKNYIETYLRNKLRKITDNYIDVLYDLKLYDKALDTLVKLENNNSNIKEILYTVRISIYILELLNSDKETPLNNNTQECNIQLCKIANKYFELVRYSINNITEIDKIKEKAKEVTELLNVYPTDDSYGHLYWNFSDIRNAINDRLRNNIEVLSILETTLAKIENYQEITYNRPNHLL